MTSSISSPRGLAPGRARGDRLEKWTKTDEVWACTTCRSCETECPVGNEHIEKIVEYRRHQVLTQGSIARQPQIALENMEKHSNPWGLDSSTRMDWAKDLGLPVYGKGAKAEWCWFVGCAGALDSRNQATARACAAILKAAGVARRAGDEEGCCGARPELGNGTRSWHVRYGILLGLPVAANTSSANTFWFMAPLVQIRCAPAGPTLKKGGAATVVFHDSALGGFNGSTTSRAGSLAVGPRANAGTLVLLRRQAPNEPGHGGVNRTQALLALGGQVPEAPAWPQPAPSASCSPTASTASPGQGPQAADIASSSEAFRW